MIRLMAPIRPREKWRRGRFISCDTPELWGFRITARRATASGVFTKPYRNMPALSQIFTGQRTCLAPKPRGFQIHATKHSVMNIYHWNLCVVIVRVTCRSGREDVQRPQTSVSRGFTSRKTGIQGCLPIQQSVPN
jgi:hypothetical protein